METSGQSLVENCVKITSNLTGATEPPEKSQASLYVGVLVCVCVRRLSKPIPVELNACATSAGRYCVKPAGKLQNTERDQDAEKEIRSLATVEKVARTRGGGEEEGLAVNFGSGPYRQSEQNESTNAFPCKARTIQLVRLGKFLFGAKVFPKARNKLSSCVVVKGYY